MSPTLTFYTPALGDGMGHSGAATGANCFMVGAFWPLMMTALARQSRK